ncbi:hypothetical protein [Methylobacterium oryzisoli]|uniref:hypothetical protein n=1 Tax=Methylobacterium oryzisoli TaxID=3385502 RepID=UPI003891C205
MTPSEFKAWFEGFTESMDGPPSLKQWERIQARVKQITGQPTTQTVFVDRYWPSVLGPRWHGTYAVPCAAGPGQNGVTLSAGSCDGKVGNVAFASTALPASFDSHSAMAALGRADAEDLKAA